ncbi:MAG TPA: hypothetical protein VEV38_12030 [Candidatus Eremiobacteraceae bacterium]|nr:hypothetical protein [Candidatus Eremiobacteraceae bacterium]
MKLMVTAATLAALVVSAGAAMATPVVPRPANASPTPTQSQRRNQQQSNENLRVARRHIEAAIDGLQRDASDYGGHKEAARDDLGVARQFLDQALDLRAGHGGNGGGNGSPIPAPVVNPAMNPVPVPTNVGNGNGEENGENGTGGADIRNQRGSTQNLMNVRSHIDAAIDALNADRSDYGGFKSRAIDKLQQARQELEGAIDFINNPNVRNGGTGEGVSNANLHFVDVHINTAISSLQADRNDYGGHRVAAINDLQTASSDIQSALAFDKAHPGQAGVRNNGVVAPTAVNPNGVMGTNNSMGQISQNRSNQSLDTARNNIEQAIDALTRDAHDYGGFREKAVSSLQAARTELDQALKFQKR